MVNKLFRFHIEEVLARGGYVYAKDEETAREIINEALYDGIIGLSYEDSVETSSEVECEVNPEEIANFLILNPEDKEKDNE